MPQPKDKVLPDSQGPIHGAALIFVLIALSQTLNARSCRSTDTGLVCRVECLVSSHMIHTIPLGTGDYKTAGGVFLSVRPFVCLSRTST